MSNICILVLCGLPASGKTTLANKIKESLKQNSSISGTQDSSNGVQRDGYHCIHISYDKLLPSKIESEIILEAQTSALSRWKEYRTEILKAVDGCISQLHETGKISTTAEHEDGKQFYGNFHTLYHEHVIVANNVKNIDLKFQNPQKLIVLVDDNMYYASMRYQYFQMARKYNIGFAQIFLKCTTDVALARNSGRQDKVSSEVILGMETKMELPCEINHWERNVLVLDCEDAEYNLDQVDMLIEKAFQQPVESLPPETDPEQVQQSRIQCSSSTLHQIDQILRKLVAQELATFKSNSSKCKEDTKHFAAKVNKERTDLLQNFKSGKILISSELEEQTFDASKDCMNPLYKFVCDMFTKQLFDVG